MNNSWRRVGALTAVAALGVAGLAGCSSGNKAGDNKAGDAKGATEITYMHRLPDGKGMVLVNDIVAKWNKDHPDAQVKATKFPGKADEMIKKLETDIKADNGPCLAQLGYAEVPEMFNKGMVEDVTKEAESFKDHYSSAFDLMKVGETTVGIPQDVGPLLYMYNKAEFDKLGLKVPTTSAELAEVAKKAAAQGKFAVSFQPDEAQNWLSGQAAAAGDTWYKPEGKEWTVNTAGEGTMKVAKFWQDMLASKAALTEERWGDGFKAAVKDHKLIGTIAAAWEPALFVDEFGKTDNKGQWRVAQLPKFGDKDATGPDGGSGVAVMKGCKAKEKAVEFADWFNTQVEDLATQGLIPAAKTKATTPKGQLEFFGDQDLYAEFLKANENMQAFPYIPGFSTVGPKMKEAAAAAVKGGPVEDIFKAAQDASVKALEDLNLPVKK